MAVNSVIIFRSSTMAATPGSKPDSAAAVPFCWLLTFLAMQVATVFFRFPYDEAKKVFMAMFSGELGTGHFGTGATVMLIVAAGISLVEERRPFLQHLGTGPRWLRIAWIVVALFLLELFSVTDAEIPFVYFQF